MSDLVASRRAFLAALGVTAAAWDGLLAADTPELKATGANLGSLFPAVERLEGKDRFADSFLGDRFKSYGEFEKEARGKLDELLYPRPEVVEPKAEVVERVDEGDFVREKVVFSTTPYFRVPGYVLVPKKGKGPFPAIVDLHSHGGMFLFGKAPRRTVRKRT